MPNCADVCSCNSHFICKGMETPVTCCQKHSDVPPIPDPTVASGNLSGEYFSELLHSIVLWTEASDILNYSWIQQLKLEKESKLARLDNITRKAWWGDSVWEGRQHTPSQGDAGSSFPKKPPNEDKENTHRTAKRESISLLIREENAMRLHIQRDCKVNHFLRAYVIMHVLFRGLG